MKCKFNIDICENWLYYTCSRMKCELILINEWEVIILVNVKKLKAKLVECGYNVDAVADNIGIDRATFYRRLANNGETFTIGEADSISRFLMLTKDEVNAIFFSQYVA